MKNQRTICVCKNERKKERNVNTKIQKNNTKKNLTEEEKKYTGKNNEIPEIHHY